MRTERQSCSQKALKMSAKARYALRVVLDVALHQMSAQPRTLASIAKDESLSPKFLSRIVIPLRRKGLLRSVRGKSGGFRLARNAEDITLLEIVEAMQGPLAILDCLADPVACPRGEKCFVRRVWSDVNLAFARTLSQVSVASILRKRAAGETATFDFCI